MSVPDENGKTIGDYLRELVADQERLLAYIYDNDAREEDLAGSGLSEEDQEILRRGELEELCRALQEEAGAGIWFHVVILP